MAPAIDIPAELLPEDGRFGCGPSKVRPAQVDALHATGRSLLGTSHRQKTVKSLVGRLRAGLGDLFTLPDGYEVVLGVGGATAFWDIATFGLVRERSQHAVLGEFSSKFAASTRGAPFLAEPSIVEAAPGGAPTLPRRGRHRRLRPAAQRDVHRRRHARAAGRAAPTRVHCCSSTRRAGRAGCPSTSPSAMRTTSPPRSASPPTGACGSR